MEKEWGKYQVQAEILISLNYKVTQNLIMNFKFVRVANEHVLHMVGLGSEQEN